jgi:hypothetical protein
MDGGLAVEMPSSPRGRGGSGSEVAIDLPGGSSYLSKCMHIALSRRVRHYVISLVVYYAIGVGFYATGTVQLRQYEIEEEEEEKVQGVDNAIFFITVMITTVGYGDFVPNNVGVVFGVLCALIAYRAISLSLTSQEGGRLFTALYGLVGVVGLATFLLEVSERWAVEKVRSKTLQMTHTVQQARYRLQDEASRRPRSKKMSDAFLKNYQKGSKMATEHPIAIAIMKMIFSLLVGSGIIFAIARDEDWETNLLGQKHRSDKWSFIDAFYFTVITATTIGFGDLVPKSDAGRWITIIIMPWIVFYCGGQVQAISSNVAGTDVHQEGLLKSLSASLEIEAIKAMATNEGGDMSEGAFIEYVLTQAQLVNPSILKELRKVFRKLDESGNGKLQEDELEARATRLSRNFAESSAASASNPLVNSLGSH